MNRGTRMLDYFSVLTAEDESLPLTEAALALGQDAYPDLDIQGALAEIDALVLRLKRRIPEQISAVQKLNLLNRFFFRELGFSSNRNDYYDPENSFLNVVLHKRRGIAVSLAVLYIEMAQQLGLTVNGVSFPGHFLLRAQIPAGEVVLDPTTGASLSEAQLMEMLEPYISRARESIGSTLRALLQPASSREIMARMLRNLKIVYLHTERWQRLLAVQERLVILLPQDIEERRDRGLALARLDYCQLALEDLEHYLEACPQAEDAMVVESQLSELRQRVKAGRGTR